MVLLRLHHAYGIALAHHSQSGWMVSGTIGFEWCQAPCSLYLPPRLQGLTPKKLADVLMANAIPAHVERVER
jgi:hypothetical protein